MTDGGWKNKLYFGDNLYWLREAIADESVDLVYLDPPFNSNASYNVLFKETSGEGSAAQIHAFEDTWHWGPETEREYQDTVMSGPRDLGNLLQAMLSFLGRNDMMAYLVMMAPRLVELHRVLKPTGSIYLHCDPTASHYIKLLMDAVFGVEHYLNEVIWKRTNARSTTGKWPRLHDVLLFYSKGNRFTFRPTRVQAEKAKLPHTLVTGPDGAKYQSYELTAPGQTRDGDSGLPWRGYDPSKMGRHWANRQETLDEWDARGLIHWPKDGGFPRRRDEHPFDPDSRMVTVGDVWIDIDRINQSAKERLGYPTQKPESLMERIINASSDEGDVVLDPFCGCGTAVTVAERFRRRWIGMDVTYLAINLMERRLKDTFGERLSPFEVEGNPTDLLSAVDLANRDRYQFQWWALTQADARPASDGKKKGADQGIDGYIDFFDDFSGKAKSIIVQVKSGHVNSGMIRDLRGVVEREHAAMGVFITLEEPSKPMRDEAVSSGFYSPEEHASMSPENYENVRYPRLQIVTVKALLDGERVKYPALAPIATFRRAERKRQPERVQQRLLAE